MTSASDSEEVNVTVSRPFALAGAIYLFGFFTAAAIFVYLGLHRSSETLHFPVALHGDIAHPSFSVDLTVPRKLYVGDAARVVATLTNERVRFRDDRTRRSVPVPLGMSLTARDGCRVAADGDASDRPFPEAGSSTTFVWRLAATGGGTCLVRLGTVQTQLRYTAAESATIPILAALAPALSAPVFAGAFTCVGIIGLGMLLARVPKPAIRPTRAPVAAAVAASRADVVPVADPETETETSGFGTLVDASGDVTLVGGTSVDPRLVHWWNNRRSGPRP